MEQYIDSFKKLFFLVLFIGFSWVNLIAQSAGPDQDVACNSATMAATGGPGLWTTAVVGVTFADDIDAGTVVNGLQVGANDLIWTVGGTDYVVTITRYEANAGLDQPDNPQCTSAVLSATNTPVPGLWSTGTGGVTFVSNTDPATTVNNLPAGSATTLTWTIESSAGCNDVDQVEITNNTPTATTGADRETCDDNQVQLGGNQPLAGYSGLWTQTTGGVFTFTDDTQYDTWVTGLSIDDHTFRWALTDNASGCSASSEVIITNNTVVAVARDVTICGPDANLDADPLNTGETGLWTTGDIAITISTPASPNSFVSGLSDGANTFNWEITKGGCSDDMDIVVTSSNVGPNAGPDQHVCVTTATMKATGNGTWSLVGGSGATTIPTSSISPVTGLEQGAIGNAFRWTVTEGACAGYDDVIIYNDTPSTSDAGAPQTSCNGTAPLSANNPVYGTGLWTAVPATAVFGNDTQNLTTVSNLSPGLNTLTWTITNGICTSVSTVAITYDVVPPVSAGADLEDCVDLFTLHGSDPTGAGSGLWTITAGSAAFADPTLWNTTVTGTTRGLNTYVWTVTVGSCSVSDEVDVYNYSVTASAGADDYTCDGDYQMNGNNPALLNIANPPTAATGTWSFVTAVPATTNIVNPALFNTEVTGLPQGATTLRWTVTNGECTEFDDVVISNDRPTEPNAGPDNVICAIDFSKDWTYTADYDLGANPTLRAGETGSWSIVAGNATFVDPTSQFDATITDLDHFSQLSGPDYWNQNPTVNTFRWTIRYKNCELSDEVDIINAAPFEAIAGDPQTVCWYDVDLNATDRGWGAQTHFWAEQPVGTTPTLSIYNPDRFNAHVDGLQNGTTSFRWTKENTITYSGVTQTCTLYDDTQVIRIDQNVAEASAGLDQAVCANWVIMSADEPKLLDGSTTGLTGVWSTLIGGGDFVDRSLHNTRVDNLPRRNNIFRWTVTYDYGAGTCIVTDDVEILNALPSTPSAGPDRVICTDNDLLSAARPTRGTGQWISTNPPPVTITATSCSGYVCNANVYNLEHGQNVFTWRTTYNYTNPNTGVPEQCTLDDDIIITNNSVTADAGAPQTVCEDEVNLTGNIPLPGETGEWTTVSGANIVNANSALTLVTNLPANNNTFTWTISKGTGAERCTSSANVIITNDNPTDPTATGTDPDGNICATVETVQGNPPSVGVGSWSVTTGVGVFANSLASTTVVSNLIQELNELTWTITEGICSESATVAIYNKSVTANAGSDVTLCSGEIVQLNAQAPTVDQTGVWIRTSGSGDIDDATAFNTTISNSIHGESNFRWTLSNAWCDDSDVATVYFYEPTIADIVDNTREVCKAYTDLTAVIANEPTSGRGEGLWSVGTISGTNTPVFTDETYFNTTVTNLGYNQTDLKWTITLETNVAGKTCVTSDEISMYNNYVSSNAGSDDITCDGDYDLIANDPQSFGLSNAYAYATGKWTLGVGATGTFGDDTNFITDISGLNTTPPENPLIWTITKGSGAANDFCSASSSVVITNNIVTADAGVDQYLCRTSTTNLLGNVVSGSKGLWTQSGGGLIQNPTLFNTLVTALPPNSTANTFRWTVELGGCPAFDEVDVYNIWVEANAGPDQDICSGDISMPAVKEGANETGEWTVRPSGTFEFTSLFNSNVTGIVQGNGQFTWTVTRVMGDGNNCVHSDDVNITNNAPDDFTIEADKESCTNFNTISVNPSPAIGTGVWTTNQGAAITNDNSINTTVTNLAVKTNEFIWTVTNQFGADVSEKCVLAKTMVITNNAVVANAGSDQPGLCSNFTSLGAADPGSFYPAIGTGHWEIVSSVTGQVDNSLSPISLVTNLSNGNNIFKWVVEEGVNCTAEDNVTLVNRTVDAVVSQSEINLCTGDLPIPLPGVDPVTNSGLWTLEGSASTGTINTPSAFNSTYQDLADGSTSTLRWTVSNSDCSDYETITVRNNSFNVDAGSSQALCSADFTMAGATDPGTATGTWTYIGGSGGGIIQNSTNKDTQITDIVSGGSSTFRWTIDNGTCVNYDEVTLTNNSPSPADITTANNTEICNGTINLIAVAPMVGNGVWTQTSGVGLIGNPSNNNIVVSGLSPGTNMFNWTVTNNSCPSVATVTIINNEVTADAGTDQLTLCANNTNMTATLPSGAAGYWTDLGAGSTIIIDNSTVPTTLVSNLPTSLVSFSWTVTKGGCSDIENVSLHNRIVVADVSGTNSSVCSATATLSANPLNVGDGETGYWTIGLPNTATFTGNSTQANCAVDDLSNSAVNEFTWHLTNGDCSDTDVAYINNNAFTIKAFGEPVSPVNICGSTHTMSADPPGTGTGVWTWNSGNALVQNSTQYNSPVINVDENASVFTWTVTRNGCTDDDQVTLINNSIEATATDNRTTCDGSLVLDGYNPDPDGTGVWRILAGAQGVLSNSTSNSATVSGLGYGNTQLSWTITSNVGNCVSEKIITVINNDFELNAGDAQTVCVNQADLNVTTTSGAGYWTVVGGSGVFDNSASSSTTVRSLEQNNVFQWNATYNSCPKSDQVIITNRTIDPSLLSDIIDVCGSSTTLNATDPGSNSGLWTVESDPTGITITEDTQYNATVDGILTSSTFRWTVSNESCSEFDEVTVNNNSFTMVGSSKPICDFEDDLSGDATLGSGIWRSSSSNPIIQNSTNPNTHVTNLDYGLNKFTWTVTNASGCEATATHELINNSPTPASAGADIYECKDNTILNATSLTYGTGLWEDLSNTPGLVIATPTNNITDVTGLPIGAITFRWTATYNGCTDTDEVVVHNDSFVLSAGSDITACLSTATFSADVVPVGGNGFWQLVSGNGLIANSTQNNSGVSNLGQTTNVFRWTVTNSAACTVSDEVNITNNQPSIPNVGGDDPDRCNSFAVISGDPAPVNASGLWSKSGGSTIVDPTNNITNITGLTNGLNQFTWTITKGLCTASNTVDIVYNGVTASVNSDFSTCNFDNVDLKASNPLIGTGSWYLVSGAGIIDNSNDYETTVSGIQQGDNIFSWTVINGTCSDDASITITNNAPTISDAGTDINTCGTSISLLANDPSLGIGSGLWTKSFGSEVVIHTPSAYNSTITIPVKANPYRETLTWTMTNGICTSEDAVDVYQNSFINFANADDYTCDGTYALTGRDPTNVSPTATGEWSVSVGGGAFDNSLSNITTVSGLDLDVNTLVWTITNVVNGGGADDCAVSEDVIITNDEVYAQANEGANALICDDFRPLTANNPALIGATGVWTLPNPNGQIIDNSLEFNTTVRNLKTSINQLKWTVTKNLCVKSTIIDVEYYVPNANITMGDVVHACSAETPLTADAPPASGYGRWSLKYPGAATIDNNSLANTDARNLDIKDNVFVWTVTDRTCEAKAEVSINNSLPINSDGSDQAGCSNTFNMNAQVPTATGSGLWTVVSSSGSVVFADDMLASTQVTVPYGNNILKWTISDNGCTAEKDFNIDNNLTNPIASDGDTVKVCQDWVQLSGSQPAIGETGVWTIDGTAGSEVFNNASVYNPVVSNLRKGQITFRWTVSNGNCTDYDLAVVVNNTPIVDAGSDTTICENYINLAGSIPGTGETGLWTIGSTVVIIDNDTKYNTHVSNLGNTNTFTWTIDNGICTNFDEVVITSRSIDVSAGLAYQEACADTLSLEATNPADVGSGTGTGVWSATSGSGTFDDASSYLTIGRNLRDYNKLRWTIVDNGCTYSDDIEFVSLLPTVASTGADKPVCDNSTQITGQQPNYALGETGLWEVASGTAAITDATSFQTQVTGLNLGTNIFRWTISNSSCSDEDYITITNNQVFADAGADQPNVCDSVATISANVISGIGYWATTSSTAIIENSLAATTNVSRLAFGANNFQWTITNNGCTKVDEVTITSILPRNVSAGADDNICTGVYNLTASNPGIGTGLWELTGGAGSFADDTANQTTVSGLATGDNLFTWTVTVNGCSEDSQVRISNNSIYVTAGTDQTICNLSSITLDGTIPGTGVVGTWSVQGGSGTFVSNSVYNTNVSGFTKGTNSYRWTLYDGNCTNYADVIIINNTPDSAKVEPNQFLCEDYTTINAIPVSVGTGKWKVSSGNGTIINPTLNNTDVTGINNGLNTFTWTVTKNGCLLAADINVTNNSVDAYIADKSVVICTPTHTATIIGNAPLTGQTGFWTKQNPADAGIIVSSVSNVTSVTNLANGDTYFTWTIENGLCSNSDVMYVTNNYYNTTANPAGPNTLCEDYSPIIGGVPPAGGTGLWSSTAPDVTFDSDTKVSTIVRNLPGGTTAITWTVTKDGCSAPASFNLVNNAIYTSAGKDQIVCQNSAVMNAQALLGGETGRWTVDNALVVITDTSDPTTAVSNLIPGNNTFTWTLSSNGCTATDVVIVSDNSFAVTAGNDDIACGTSYNLAASDPLSGIGLWTVSSGTGRFANASNYQTAVLDMDNGVNTFTWTVNRNGCEDADDVAITNNFYIAVAGEDRPICSTQTTVSAQPLNPTWGASGLWTAQTGGGVFADPSSESTLVSGLASGDNRLRWTITKTESGTTCTSYDEIVITNNSITAAAGTNETTCDNFATLSATPLSATGTGLWSGGGVYTVIVDPTSATTLVTDLQQGTNTFAWTVNDKGCSGTSTVKVTSNYFVADAGASQVVTVNSATMAATLPDATATGAWTTFSGSGSFADPTDPTETVTALGFGVNTFRWEVKWNSCTASDDVDITYNAISAEAGLTQTICENETYLKANNPSPGIGIWSTISGSAVFDNINDPNTRVSGIQPGSINIFRWTVEIGGYSEYDDVTVLNSEFTISAGSDKEECYNTSTMTAESAGAGTGTWSVLAGGGNFANGTLNNTDVTSISEGINLFVWRVVKNTGCVNSDTVQVVYNLPPTAGFDMDQSAGCTPIDVTFTNTSVNGQTYYWNFGDDFRTDTSLITFTRTYEALYDKDSIYDVQLVAESAKGCYDTIVQQVTTYRIPLVGFSATPISQLFPRSEITIENLSGDGYLNYYWDMDDGNTYLQNSMVESFSHKYDSWGEYTITLSVFSNNCSDTARQTVIIVAPQPVTTIKPGLRAKGCEDLSVYFEAFVNYADTFHWDFGDGGTSEEQDPTYIYDTPGTYIVTLSADGPGTDSLIVVRRDTVKVFEVPIADFEAIPDTVMLPNQPVILHNNSISADIYQWNFGSGDPVSSEKSPTHYYTEEGIYTITLDVWTNNGCHDSKSIENAVVVEPAGTFQFPSAINPFSKTEINRVFKPKHRGIREYKLEIYNRWGEKVFESTDPEIGWKGYIDGKVGAQDVYVWKVSGKYKNGILFTKTGDVTLLR